MRYGLVQSAGAAKYEHRGESVALFFLKFKKNVNTTEEAGPDDSEAGALLRWGKSL